MKRLVFLIMPLLLITLWTNCDSERQSLGQSPAESDAPTAVRPFSQAVKAGGFIFVSGQIGLDPKTGKVAEGDIGIQTRQALENIEAALKNAGAGLEHVVKTTVYLQNMDDYAAMNKAYSAVFGETRPARATVAVRELVMGVLIEIEAIALAPEYPGEIIHM